MKILLVDDSKAMRMIVRKTLKNAGFEGHEMVEAENGKEAIEVVENERPHLVLSDWNMPEMKGIELLRELRERGNQTKLGFVTSESSPEIRKEADDAGAAFLITMPFTPQAFYAALNPILGS